MIPPNAGKGRPKGAKNRSGTRAREALARLIELTTPRMRKWLIDIEKNQGPQAAWKCMIDIIEFHIPKLARTELVGKDGGPIETIKQIIHEHHDA